MSSYHQIGHHSDNLLHEPGLRAYRGAILSPVNYEQAAVAGQIERASQETGFDMIFDPQLYLPNSDRGVIRQWSYFPTDVDTADLSLDAWWEHLNEALVDTCRQITPAAVCSPAVVPNAYSDDYFELLVRVCDHLARTESLGTIRAIQSAIVGLPDLATRDRPLTIASILSRTSVREIYLVLVGATEPRREISEVEMLKGAMRLIAALEAAGLRVIVGYSSSDVVLWKAAGATHCATGKFFNLRRFTRARFEEPSGGGGQLPYWFHEPLMAFLRESDLQRVLPLDLQRLNEGTNPFSSAILAQLENEPGKAWLAEWNGRINGSGRSPLQIFAVVAPPTSQDLFRYFQKRGDETKNFVRSDPYSSGVPQRALRSSATAMSTLRTFAIAFLGRSSGRRGLLLHGTVQRGLNGAR